MSLAQGGLIKQTICTDHSNPEGWQPDHTLAFNVQFVNSALFQQITGEAAPPTPVDARVYALTGFPFYEMYEEASAVHGDFSGVRSIAQIENMQEEKVEPTVALLDSRGRRANPAYEKFKKEMVYDPCGLLDPLGPLRGFRTVRDMEEELGKLSLGTADENRGTE